MEKWNSLLRTGQVFLLCLISLCLFSSNLWAADKKTGQVVVVVIDGVSLDELLRPQYRAINNLVSQGTVGLFNARTGGALTSPNAYATLGAGKKAEASSSYGLAFNAQAEFEQRKVKDIFYSRTGKEVADQNIVHIGVPEMQASNANSAYGAVLGSLGENLQQLGVRTVVIGNSATDHDNGGLAALLAMDTQGIVAGGSVDGSLTKMDNRWPYGLRTDYQRLWQTYTKWKGAGNFLVIDTADTYRLNQGKDEVPETIWQGLRQEALQQADGLIGQIAQELDWHHDRLVVLVPTPDLAAIEQGDVLTPVIMAGKDVSAGSVIRSVNTRKVGLATLPDFAPTIVSFWGGQMQENVIGRPLQFIPMEASKEYITEYHQKIFTGFKDRVPVLVSVCILWFIVVGAALYQKFRSGSKLCQLQPWLLFIMMLPIGLLWVPMLGLDSWYLKVLEVGLITGGLWLLIRSLVSKGWPQLLATVGLVSFALLVDALSSGSLSQFSPLGFDLILGARYYGLGNEFMGLLIAAVVLVVALLYQVPQLAAYRSILTFALFVLVTLALALPVFGANFGGTITAVVTFSLMGLKLQDKQIGWREVLYIILGVVIVISFVAIMDLFKANGDSTHIAKAIRAFSNGDLVEVGRIIDRKVSMNLTILRLTGWSLLLWIVGACYLVYRPQPWLQRLIAQYRGIGPALVSGAIGSVIALLFNDSGAIAAACILAFFTPAILYLELESKRG